MFWIIPKRWLIGLAVVAWIVVLNAQHESDTHGTQSQTGARQLVPCVVRVVGDNLNVRTGPGLDYPAVGTLDHNAIVPAARTTQGRFRQLGPGRWIGRWTSDAYLEPVPGANCG